MRRQPTPAIDRVMPKVRVDDNGCWVFTGSVNAYGYGRTSAGSKVDGTMTHLLVHRVTYMALVGPVPDGLDLDHLCRVRACCNPDHLEPVTRRENLLRGQTITAHHAGKTHCVAGHELAGSNLRLHPRARHTERICVTCNRERSRRNRERRRAAA